MRLNPGIKIFEVSSKTGQGIGDWAQWLKKEVDEFRSG
jgi:hydrogenase nickel incorporation protein HypB